MISDLTIRFGGAGAAEGARDRVGWNGFGKLVPLLASRDVSLIGAGCMAVVCEVVFCAAVRPACQEGK